MKTSVAISLLSCSVERSAAPSRRACFGAVALMLSDTDAGTEPRRPWRSTLAAVAPSRISWVSERVLGEKPWVPTCSDSSRFVLPVPLRPVTRTNPGSKLELQPGIRPEVAKRDLGDDQPASLIGMIRYQNESSEEVISPGRSGLMSFNRTVSPRTASTPSARNSALNPISSGSPV